MTRPTHRPTHRQPRARRGQAVVELAILMVVLVPLILYTLFLQDMLVYQLDWQEAIVTPAWDALPYDYMRRSNVRWDVQHYNRLTYCDHTAAYDAYPTGDCDDITHHKALTAHQCWVVPGGQQVTCSLESDVGAQVDATVFGATGLNGGGLLHCTARLGVMNYFLPQKVFGWASEAEITDRGRYYDDSDVHDDAAHGFAENHWILGDRFPDSFGVLHDSWSMSALATIDPTASAPGPGNRLYERVEPYYSQATSRTGATARAQSLAASLARDELLSPTAALRDDALGDNPATPSLAYREDDPTRAFQAAPRGGGVNYASGYVDQRQADTYESPDRDDAYFGVPIDTW